jgi:hypothetical protein
MASMASILARLEHIERNLDRNTGNWVIGLSGQIIWDPWDPDDVEDGALERIQNEIELIGKRIAQEWPDPTEAEKADARRGLDEVLERYRAERQALRDFTAKIERERAEKGAP